MTRARIAIVGAAEGLAVVTFGQPRVGNPHGWEGGSREGMIGATS